MHGVLMGGAGRDTGMPARAEVLIHRRRCYQHVPVMTAQGEFRSMTGPSHLRLLRLAALCVCLLGTCLLGPVDRKSTRLNSSHHCQSRLPSSACTKTNTQLAITSRE